MPFHGEIRVVLRTIMVPTVEKSTIAGVAPKKVMKEAKVQILQQYQLPFPPNQSYGVPGEWKDVPMIYEEIQAEKKKG